MASYLHISPVHYSLISERLKGKFWNTGSRNVTVNICCMSLVSCCWMAVIHRLTTSVLSFTPVCNSAGLGTTPSAISWTTSTWQRWPRLLVSHSFVNLCSWSFSSSSMLHAVVTVLSVFLVIVGNCGIIILDTESVVVRAILNACCNFTVHLIIVCLCVHSPHLGKFDHVQMIVLVTGRLGSAMTVYCNMLLVTDAVKSSVIIYTIKWVGQSMLVRVNGQSKPAVMQTRPDPPLQLRQHSYCMCEVIQGGICTANARLDYEADI